MKKQQQTPSTVKETSESETEASFIEEIDTAELADDQKVVESSYTQASWASKTFFWWVFPML